MFEVLPPAMAKLPQRAFADLRGCSLLEYGMGLQLAPAPTNATGAHHLAVAVINVEEVAGATMTQVGDLAGSFAQLFRGYKLQSKSKLQRQMTFVFEEPGDAVRFGLLFQVCP